MSTTTEIVCRTCKVKLWVGQRNYIYTGQPETMDNLNKFLQEHRSFYDHRHQLEFVDEHDDSILDYERFGA